MILALATRYRKFIALFCYGVFYAEFVCAAEAWHGRERSMGSMPFHEAYHAGRGASSMPVTPMLDARQNSLLTPDSTIRPLHPVMGKNAFAIFHAPQSAANNALATAGAFPAAKPSIGGPTQPEMQSFQSVNANNMVDLFSGDFSYNIPLMDVGGYPVNIAYRSGISMDDDASWVGLGWNINPGSITRNMRGLPDDFNGVEDTMKKVSHIKPNMTFGASIAENAIGEIVGLPKDVLGASVGIFHNTYKGWGAEASLDASINAGSKSFGPLTAGLSLTDNSQNGLTINPSLSETMAKHDATDKGYSSGFQLSLPYNSRAGINELQLGLSMRRKDINKPSTLGSSISFAGPTYTPTINMPLTNYNLSFTSKIGGENYAIHPNLSIKGYMSREYIADGDTATSLPAYGYLNFQNIGNNWNALTDFNREKEMPYRESPPIPHIAVPAYTYDVFSISGEGTGGMFRAYRGDIGFIADPLMENKSYYGAVSVDLGAGGGIHGGDDLNGNYSNTKSGPWLSNNVLGNTIGFRQGNGLFESSYFRNPGEKAINTTAFYNAMGGDDVVAPALFQANTSDPTIMTTHTLNRYNSGQQVGTINLDSSTVIRPARDKRSQVISYLTASEASVSGLDKYITHYAVNKFGPHSCENDAVVDTMGKGTGLLGYYYNNDHFGGAPVATRMDRNLYFDWQTGTPFWSNNYGEINYSIMNGTDFSIRWLGRIKAPRSGCYTFGTWVNDGVRVWINDSLLIDDWHIQNSSGDSAEVNLIGGKFYNIRVDFFQEKGNSGCYLMWRQPGVAWTPPFVLQRDSVPQSVLYPPVFTDTTALDSIRTQEDRVNNFRKPSHISEIDVLNADGRRYVYGVPVYNLLQKEVSFAVSGSAGNLNTGMTAYSGTENSVGNTSGKDGYYSRTETPAYAHSFLLTGILSPDYVDVTGDGISDDDLGDAVKFTYSKTSGIANPYQWRAPYLADSANYNEGFRSYNRDDKAHYIYGQKELWYMHSIESKTMVANFTLQSREDLLEADEQGNKINNGKGMCLKQIDLYSKADFMRLGTSAIPIKTVHFAYSYELCPGINGTGSSVGKLTLKKIWFTYNGNDKTILNPYVFNYHPNNPGYKASTVDKWGTYKDALQNPGSTSTNLITNAEYPYALQDSATAAYNAAAWTLDSIQLPSGGRIKVNYESDDYAYVQNRRSTLMCNIAGFGSDNSGTYSNYTYNTLQDNLYAYVNVPVAVSSNNDLYAKYLDGLSKIYFRLYVRMPTDDFGSGYDYVPSYASPDTSSHNWYGAVSGNPNLIWIKIKGVNSTGDGDGNLSPLSQTCINFLRLNLPDKAYPGSEVNDNLNVTDVVKIIVSIFGNIAETLSGFTSTARTSGWVRQIDPTRSYIRLDCPNFKKYGGGLRVKSVLIYDNWKNMTGKKETVYGQTYDYTTTQSVNGTPTVISSGVATWEPVTGSEENPFHLPIEYVDRASILAPAASLYTEEPLGETFYPSPSIGYSKVRVHSIHTTGTRSANGYSETGFYTSYDFPTSWDYSPFDNNTKKRFKPLLQNLLRINAVNYLTMSQGFKVELNDMNGKERYEATYPQTDSAPISYTENFYKVDNQSVQFKHLSNIVPAIDPLGNIDTAATIGKDVEVMADMRDQTSVSIGSNININVDIFTAGAWPMILPSVLNLYQHETNQFRSAALIKIIQRYGVLDSVVHIDKGSLVSSKNLLYDAETGNPLLVRTQNEFNDSLYQFTYPSHWAYKVAGPAYQNIDATVSGVTLTAGKISGLPSGTADTSYFSAGDEVLAYSRQSLGVTGCLNNYSHFPDGFKLWVVDTNTVHGGPAQLFLVNSQGIPFSGNDVTIKVTRSGHRNIDGSVGSVSAMTNPMKKDISGNYHIVIDSTTGVLTAGAVEMQQFWKVEDKRTSDVQTSCVFTAQDSAEFSAEGCSCLQPFFSYLISSHQLVVSKWQRLSVGSLVGQAQSAGYSVSLSSCPLLNANSTLPFYTETPATTTSLYVAHIGNSIVNIRSTTGLPLPLYSLTSASCDAQGHVHFKNPSATAQPADTTTIKIFPGATDNLISMMGSTCPGSTDSLTNVDSLSDHMLVENSLNVGGYQRNAIAIMRFDSIRQKIPFWANIISAKMYLQADTRGHIPGMYDSANSTNLLDTIGYSLSDPAGWFPYQPLDTMLYEAYYTPWFQGIANKTPFQNDTLDMSSYLNNYLDYNYYSSTFILTQGSGKLTDTAHFDSTMVARDNVPPYLTVGYGNYYSTFYNQRYADTTKWPVMVVTYASPASGSDTLGAVLEFNSTMACTSVISRSCYSSVTDTMVNPYQYGILGNMRPERSYVYYGRRVESDPHQPTNVRKNGVISSFMPFWVNQSGNWQPSYDTTRWVWNSETSLFNRKGFELENNDPLGRYNSGLYGYGLTLPTAVVQNSRYRESAFEGFEDYGYIANSCDTLCPESRPFDFSAYQLYISDSMAHTGLYSLRIGKDSSVSIQSIVQPNTNDPAALLTTKDSAAYYAGTHAGAGTILPSFSPTAGKKMLISAWVKEQNSCSCQSYTRDNILLSYSQATGNTSVTLYPSGNMIEGWQRYESVVTIPANATSLTLTLQASDSSTTYFDDIRILPYNGEMKSYVYNPVNLRLMAELDENNYATYYEYDDDGTLIRVKKETERGIQTIKETHSALLKDQ